MCAGSSDEGETASGTGGGADACGGGSENAEMEENNFSRSYTGNSNPIFRDVKPLHATSAHDLSQDYPRARSAHQNDFSPVIERSSYDKERTPSSQEREDERKSWDFSIKSLDYSRLIKNEPYQNEYRKFSLIFYISFFNWRNYISFVIWRKFSFTLPRNYDNDSNFFFKFSYN